jgi:dTDP-4-dehydrorhamnose 3,5-epimerase-like enzyme
MSSQLKVINHSQARVFTDKRGSLTVYESACEIPFDVKRVFVVHNVTDGRGGHAHIDTDQVLFPASGSITVRTFDGNNWVDYKLIDPQSFLFIPSMIYVELINFSEGASCVVLANTKYNVSKSLRTLDNFKKSFSIDES